VGTDSNWQSVSAGNEYTMAIKSDGSLWAWGSGYTNMPTRVGTDNNWQTVSAGLYHTMAIKTDLSLWAWGDNGYGQLGLGGDTTWRTTPTCVDSDGNWQSVSAGFGHTVAITADAKLWAWGRNDYGQLGLGDTTDKNTPNHVGPDNNWRLVSAGGGHTMAIKSDGSLWAWGIHSRLGLDSIDQRETPFLIGTGFRVP
jgi:alpha-tubulin suppressor-like RCC1 family protein